MKIYLAGGMTYTKEQKQAVDELRLSGMDLEVNILLSFHDVVTRKVKILLDEYNLMLDSGAYSFISLGKRVDWDDYISRYIEYINANDVELFFELDIDKIIGYDRVKEIRRRLERETGERPIPVWHKHLGKEEFLRMCDEFDYVAIGGIVSREILPRQYKYLPWFIRQAHKRGTKIHGLGFTNSKWLSICHFDSVDSSSWLSGPKYGQIYVFDGDRIIYVKKPTGHKVKTYDVAVHNFKEWLKFANYAGGGVFMKALVLLSGGLDSATCLSIAVATHGAHNVTTVSIFYGQRHERELKSAKSLAKFYGVEHYELDLSTVFAKSNCPLMARSSRPIEHKSYAEQITDGGVATYVPFRNGLMLSAAASFAGSLFENENVEIYIGAHADDSAGNAYADCREDFVRTLNKAMLIGTYGKIRLVAPFLGKSKADVVKIGLKFDTPYELTWSCYEGGDKPCGQCATCIDRARAFELNGVTDPAEVWTCTP